MTKTQASGAVDARSSRAGRVDKRQATLDAALAIFAHHGYSRASVDTIAQRAAVSTRTLYKHFGTKEGLFTEVVRMSTTRMADADLTLIDEHLPPGALPQTGLVAFARAWVGTERQTGDWPVHEALFHHIQADLDNIPPAVIATWLDVGPRKVLHALADRFRSWSADGVLRIADPEVAAAQFAQLVMPGSVPGIHPDLVRDRDAWVGAAVDLFLRGYGAPDR